MDLTADDIMIRAPVTASPTELLASANVRMMRQGLGGLPIVLDGEVVGIITHRDTILAGKRVMKNKILDIMTKNVLTIKRDTGINEIMRIMRDTGYQRLPVVDEKKLVGLVTQSCVINAMAR